jgi:cytochrome c biogenesis protein CcmG/thiol:disulfide interchange protein DsbE
MKRKLILISPLIIFTIIILLSLSVLYKHSLQKSFSNKLRSGQEVFLPKFSLASLYEEQSSLSNKDFTQKYSLINVFASWCVSCAQEHRVLLELSKNNNLNIYGIAWRDVDKNTKEYLKRKGNPYKKVAIDNKGLTSKLLSVSGTPESFLVDSKGRVIYHQIGVIDDKFLDILSLMLRKSSLRENMVSTAILFKTTATLSHSLVELNHPLVGNVSIINNNL